MSDFVKNVSQIRITRAMAWLTSTIALVLGAIGVLNTMIMSVFERTKEIGTLRAIGWKKLRVMRMILSESLLLSLLGGARRRVAAVVMLRVLSRMPLTSGLIEGDVAPPVILQGFAIAAVVGLLVRPIRPIGARFSASRGDAKEIDNVLRNLTWQPRRKRLYPQIFTHDNIQ